MIRLLNSNKFGHVFLCDCRFEADATIKAKSAEILVCRGTNLIIESEWCNLSDCEFLSVNLKNVKTLCYEPHLNTKLILNEIAINVKKVIINV